MPGVITNKYLIIIIMLNVAVYVKIVISCDVENYYKSVHKIKYGKELYIHEFLDTTHLH